MSTVLPIQDAGPRAQDLIAGSPSAHASGGHCGAGVPPAGCSFIFGNVLHRAGGLPRSRESRPHQASRGSADADWFHRPRDVGATRGAAMLVAPASRRRWWCTDAGWFYRPRIRIRPLSRSLPLFRTLPSAPAFWAVVTHLRPSDPASHGQRGHMVGIGRTLTTLPARRRPASRLG